MQVPAKRTDPDGWIRMVFSARAAKTGGVVRRSAAWVEREVGRDRFVAAVRARGFHLIECGGQYVVICNSAGMRVVF